MKKLLISTSALVVVAGAASAQVTLTGTAEAGLAKGPGKDAKLNYYTTADVNFRSVGTTDGGLQFGATIDLDEAASTGATNGKPSVFITSTGFGTLTMGDTDGAFDRSLDEVGMLTSIADDHTSHKGYSGNGGLDGRGRDDPDNQTKQVLRYDRQFGIFELAVSMELGQGKLANGKTRPGTIGLGGALDFGGGDRASYGVGLGWQSSGESSIFGLSATAKFSGVDIVVNYSTQPSHNAEDVKVTNRAGKAEGGTHLGLGVGYTINDLALSFNYGTFSGGPKDGQNGWGMAANYALSGGAVIQVGLSSSGSDKADSGNGTDEELRYSVGLSLNF